jgi:hypothetical protein
MNIKLKEFEELLFDNTLFKVKIKSWEIEPLSGRSSQEFIKEQIPGGMELTHSDEQSYQLELHAY